ncbi:MAG: hypothetical protein MKZ95_17920 [Pirellulales bacterium]|nr:hypothetical protein [Pirellulales bacterium]
MLPTCCEVVRACGSRVTWCGENPEVLHLAYNYADEANVTHAEMKRINERLQRSKTLPKYDITIKPTKLRGR